MDLLSKQAYEDSWQALNRYLRLVEQRAGLGAALHGLNRHQIQTGFIRDQLGKLKRYFFPAPDDSGRFFTVQYNPARGYRHQGAGRPQTETTEWAVNGGCFLCADNIWWQQSGTESGYHLPGPLDRYTAWMNPFPLAPAHAIVSSRKHQPQHWQHGDGLSLERLISDLVDLSAKLSNWLCFYNGVGAGASIPHHLHFHVLPRSEAHSQFPLEYAASRSEGLGNVVTHYPLPAVHWRGEPSHVKEQAINWAEQWQLGAGGDENASANLIATRSEGALDLYFIPRHRGRARAEGLAGIIGGFEAMGEIVCSTAQELAWLESGAVGYNTIDHLLRQVAVAL